MTERSDGRLQVFSELDFTPLAVPWAAGGVWRLSRPMPAWLGVVTTVLAMTAGSTALFSFIGLGGQKTPAQQTFFLVCGFGSIAIVVAVIVFHRVWNRRFGRRLVPVNPELPAFAAANGMEYRESALVDASLPAASGQEQMVQRIGSRLTPADGAAWPPFVIGRRFFHRPVPADFVPTERSPYPITVDESLFAAVPLPRSLPHIALLRPADLSDTHLDIGTRYAMGIEFDRTFTLLCPPGYERDALYLFTPDVMAAMLDDAGAAQWAAEVLDDWLFFRFPISTAPGVVFEEDLRRAFLLIERTSAQLTKQAENYRDARIGDRTLDRVTDAGRRVTTRVRPTMVIAAFGLPLMILAPFAVLMIGNLAV